MYTNRKTRRTRLKISSIILIQNIFEYKSYQLIYFSSINFIRKFIGVVRSSKIASVILKLGRDFVFLTFEVLVRKFSYNGWRENPRAQLLTERFFLFGR